MPETPAERNITASIDNICLGENTSPKRNGYRIEIPAISLNTYKEIVKVSCTKQRDRHKYELMYFKLSKQTGDLKKSDVKNIINFALSICPACQYSNCLCCPKRGKFRKYMKKYNGILKTNRSYPKFIKCFYCKGIFKTRYSEINYDNYRYIPFPHCDGWQCADCKEAYAKQYSEFLSYLIKLKSSASTKLKTSASTTDTTTTTTTTTASTAATSDTDANHHNHNYHNNNNNNNTALSCKLQLIYNCLSDEAKREIRFSCKTFYYSVYVNEKLIPPLAFFIDMNKPLQFYEKLLLVSDILDLKTKYGSVNTRSQGGKNCIFRSNGLNKRYVESGRLVIVPRRQLQPHQCLLPDVLYRRLNCPKHIIGHRYPTLDVRSMAYLEVIGTWEYPCLAISTAIVYGMNGDFDGDCLHIIPAHNFHSQAELLQLAHPRHNMIIQKQLRVKFDHDEVQTIYSEFGVDCTEIHNAIYAAVIEKSSPFAYDLFCNLRNYCHWVWEYKSIPTITFENFNEIHGLFDKQKEEDEGMSSDYLTFINRIFPAIKPHNGIKEIINAKSSRFSIDHLWQIFGEINTNAKTGFIQGLSKDAFIKMATISRNAMVKDVGYFGYNHIKLAHCTKTVTVGHDGFVYTSDGVLVARSLDDIY